MLELESKLEHKIHTLSESMHTRFDEILTGQDKIIKILSTLNDEAIATKETLRRHEEILSNT